MFEKVLLMTKWHIATLSLYMTGVGIYFFFTLFTHVKIEVAFSVFVGLYFVLVSVAGFATFYFSLDKFDRYYAYFTIGNILLNLCLLIIASYAIIPSFDYRDEISKKIEKFLNESANPQLDSIQISLRCCGISSAEEFTEYSGPKIVYKLPLSCCEDLNRERKCSKELAYPQGCWSAYKEKLYVYKTRAIVLICLATIFKVLMIIAYAYKIKRVEDS